jgi:23S rRNA pseudouridine1911/1915/1917 synthase
MQGVIVPPEYDEERLDHALLLLFPGTGLRHRRRLFDQGLVLVDGRLRAAAFKVRPGQQIEFLPRLNSSAPAASEAAARLWVVHEDGQFAAVCKPAKLHSAAIEGKDEPCVERELPRLFPGQKPVLLNRLDFETSGILLVALSGLAELRYRTEDSAKVHKRYLALVRGRVDGEFRIKRLLDTDNRKRTRVLVAQEPSFLRWTRVRALVHLEARGATLLQVSIHKGARHQIRAHLSAVGHPIVGDPLYGEGEPGIMYLHHYRIELPGFTAEILPEWPDLEIPHLGNVIGGGSEEHWRRT